jgi:hypothetical protein
MLVVSRALEYGITTMYLWIEDLVGFSHQGHHIESFNLVSVI